MEMSRKHHYSTLIFAMVSMLMSLAISSQPCLADEIIKGHYCYTHGDNESLREARELTKTLAIRNAIESYRVFIESTSKVQNFQLTNDIVQMISSGYLKDIKVLEHTEEGRTVCDTIQATVSPQAVEKIIKREVRNRNRRIEQTGIDNNGYLKILSVWENKYEDETKTIYTGKPVMIKKRTINVRLKVLKPLLEREMSKNPHYYVCVEYYDDDGNPSSTEKVHVRDSGYIGKDLIAGEIITVTFFNQYGWSTPYRVWLPK